MFPSAHHFLTTQFGIFSLKNTYDTLYSTMIKSYNTISLDKKKLAVRYLCCFFVCFFLAGIGILARRSYYIVQQNKHDTYKNTSCLLLNYTIQSQLYNNSNGLWDTRRSSAKKFVVSYKFSNQTIVHTSVTTYETESIHNRTQV